MSGFPAFSEIVFLSVGSDFVAFGGDDALATFHGCAGDFDAPAVEAFVSGLFARHPSISIWDEARARYHLSGGQRDDPARESPAGSSVSKLAIHI